MSSQLPQQSNRITLLESPYMSGACHVHALAARAIHGGHFAALLDFEDPFGVDDDECDIPAVWHVWSVHETPEGLIARDVTGDVPVTQLKERVLQLWPEVEGGMTWGDIRIDEKMCLAELEDLIDPEGEGDRPLDMVDAEALAEACREATVTAAPGTRPAVQIIDSEMEEAGAGMEP